MYFIVDLSSIPVLLFFFFFNDTATTEIYTLSLHDALPICTSAVAGPKRQTSHSRNQSNAKTFKERCLSISSPRSEEHTSELQSQSNLVCRLLLEKKKTRTVVTRQSYRTRVAMTTHTSR